MQNHQDEALREKIVEFTRQGKHQKEIADALGVHFNTVYRYQKRIGLRAAHRMTTPLTKARILRLLRGKRRFTYTEIATLTGTTKKIVSHIAGKANLRRHGGIPDGIRAALVEDILHRRAHALSLARKYHAPYEAVLKLAKETLGCAGLRPGCPKIPLESFFPQRWPEHFAEKPEPDRYVLALEEFFNRFHGGKLTAPQNDVALIAQFLQYVPDYLQEEFGFGFAAGLDCLRRQSNLQWTN
jgi:transcriptional regulator with XRE-family HTH domain